MGSLMSKKLNYTKMPEPIKNNYITSQDIATIMAPCFICAGTGSASIFVPGSRMFCPFCNGSRTITYRS